MGKLAQVLGSSERANDPVCGLYGTLVTLPRRSSLRQHTHWGWRCSSARAGALRGEGPCVCRFMAACSFLTDVCALGTVETCASATSHGPSLLLLLDPALEFGWLDAPGPANLDCWQPVLVDEVVNLDSTQPQDGCHVSHGE